MFDQLAKDDRDQLTVYAGKSGVGFSFWFGKRGTQTVAHIDILSRVRKGAEIRVFFDGVRLGPDELVIALPTSPRG